MNDSILKELERVIGVTGPDFIADNTQQPWRKDVTTHIIETSHDTPTVDKMLGAFERQWTRTADDCVERAAELEAAAAELRNRADAILRSREYLTHMKTTVLYEIESRNRAASLALVKPHSDTDQSWAK